MAPGLAESRTGLGSGSLWLETVGNTGQSGNCSPCISPSQTPPELGSLSSSQALGTWEPSTAPPFCSLFFTGVNSCPASGPGKLPQSIERLARRLLSNKLREFRTWVLYGTNGATYGTQEGGTQTCPPSTEEGEGGRPGLHLRFYLR